MNKTTRFFISIAVIILICLFLSIYPLNAETCPTKANNFYAYQRRDNNRCEGIKTREISSKFDLIAYSTGQINNYPEILKIRIPKTSNQEPKITILSYVQNYLLDQLKLSQDQQYFLFNLKTKPILQKTNIPPKTLRATATLRENSRNVFYPVILNQATKTYNIVLYSSAKRSFPVVELRYQGNPFPSNLKPIKTPQDREIKLQWNYQNAPKGLYELYLKDNNDQERSFYLQHNPQWF